MNTTDLFNRHSLARAAAPRRASRDDHPTVRRLRPQLLADAVVAGYIHDISTRHRPVESEGERYELAVDRAAA